MGKSLPPIKLGDVEVKNSLVISPLAVGFCENDGTVTVRRLMKLESG